MKGGCHCGAVAITVARRPDFLNKCNCTLCLKLGALWGYYPIGEVAITGETIAYARADVATPSIHARFCGRCGATTHWTSTDPTRDRCGVNMRLFETGDLTGLPVRFLDARGWPTGPRDATYHPSMPFEEHIA